MNILYISSKKRWGGVSSWMRQTAIGLEAKGHQVWVLGHPKGRFIRSAPKEIRLIPRRLGMDYSPLTVSFLVRFIKSHQIDLIVTNIEKEVIAGGIAARLCGIPNIRRVGREDDFKKKLKIRWNHRHLVDQCIVPCDFVRDNAVKRAPWLDRAQFTTIYNGKNGRRYSRDEIKSQRKAWGLEENDVIIGVTSQLSKSKAIDRLIRVFKRLQEKCPEWYLVVTGEGSEKEKLAALAEELKIQERVVFAGFSSEPLLSSAGYDIAVSNSRFEGFPNNVVEYFAVGRPVVTTDAGGVSEMVRHGENALLIPCDDDTQLYESLLTLIRNPEMRKAIGRRAMETIEQGFSEDLMIERLETFFLANIKKI
jgi:glycosyltransferase involved in cell wall biosynthesis